MPAISSLAAGSVVPMPTCPVLVISVDPPTLKALPVTVRVEAVVNWPVIFPPAFGNIRFIAVVTVDRSIVDTGTGPTIVVALPTEVTGPVRFALVVTLVAVAALPLIERG